MKRQLTLGQLIYELEKYEPETEVRYDFAYFVPDGLNSYRGYYEQLALGYRASERGNPVTVEQLLNECRETVGKEFYGYKGGEYTMYSDTPVWVSNYGEVCSTAVVGVTDCGWQIIIDTAYMD